MPTNPTYLTGLKMPGSPSDKDQISGKSWRKEWMKDNRKARREMGAQEGQSCDWYCYCYMATLGEPYGTVEISRSKTRPSLKLVQLIKINITWMFSKADFALVFFFVLYFKKINSGMAFSSESGPTLKAGAVLRRHTALGPENAGLVHTMETSAESNRLGKFPTASWAYVPSSDKCEAQKK